jgi:hypothetical protein
MVQRADLGERLENIRRAPPDARADANLAKSLQIVSPALQLRSVPRHAKKL